LFAVLAVTWIVVMLNEGGRNLTVNYANGYRVNRAYGDNNHFAGQIDYGRGVCRSSLP